MATKPEPKATGISFESLLSEKTKGLTAALDDGFPLTDRAELTDRPMVLHKWEILDGIGGQKYSRVWAYVLDPATGEAQPVKFEDGGRSRDGITETLRELLKRRIRGNVAVVLRSEEYSFTDQETGAESYATRYSFEDNSGE